jgi:hypothetical protein
VRFSWHHRYIVRLPKFKAIEACAGDPNTDPTDLGDYAPLLADVSSEAYEQSWFVDPSYFQYQQCECLMVSTVACKRSFMLTLELALSDAAGSKQMPVHCVTTCAASPQEPTLCSCIRCKPVL